MPRESELTSAVLDYLALRGIYARRINSGSILKTQEGKTYRVNLAPEGTPDILACVDGKFVGIELKKDEEEYRAWQRQWEKHGDSLTAPKSAQRSIAQHKDHIQIDESGGYVITCWSLDELKEDLNSLSDL